MGSRLRGKREPGSMTPQQVLAGWLAGLLLRLTYGVRFTDMSPFRAMRVDRLRALGMQRADLWLESGNADARCGRAACASSKSRSTIAAARVACRKSPAISLPG